MDSLRQFITTFKDPEIVTRIQTLFGVSYEDVATGKSLKSEEQHCEQTTAILRKKSGQHNSDYYEVKENSNQSNENTACEDGVCNKDDNLKSVDVKDYKSYKIRNKLWYYLFFFGTYLGDEVGYGIFLPFLIWNIDSSVGRKLVLVWTVVMYIGQSIKDIVKWPRPPCPPVIRLQKKWSLEFGMPSTHAMVGVAFPSSILYYSLHRYTFPISYGVIISAIWCILISVSRLYLGMHSLLDVMVGLLLSSVLVIPLLPAVNYVDDLFLRTQWYPVALLVISIFLLYLYPKGSLYTPTLGDTATILATCVGVQFGNWFNYKYHITEPSASHIPYPIELPDWDVIGMAILRTVIGLFAMVLSFLIFDIIFKFTDMVFEKLNVTVRDNMEKRRRPLLDLSYKYLSFSIVSFHVACSLPYLFKILNVGRYSFYHE